MRYSACHFISKITIFLFRSTLKIERKHEFSFIEMAFA